MARLARVERRTAETDIRLELELDGRGRAEVATGVGFFDHMLALLARHAAFDLSVQAEGDLHVDDHHTVEDVGICLGDALAEALGEKAGIRRYGHFTLPMEESLVTAAVDLGGRPHFVWQVRFPGERVGRFDTELVAEFWQAVVNHARCNLHVVLHHGANNHHIAEAVFKAAARAVRMAVSADDRLTGVPSTKGTL